LKTIGHKKARSADPVKVLDFSTDYQAECQVGPLDS